MDALDVFRKGLHSGKQRIADDANGRRRAVHSGPSAFMPRARIFPGGNCIKIGLPGKLILSKRKGLREVLFY